jgi:indole-3-glycerol phosphate synthase
MLASTIPAHKRTEIEPLIEYHEVQLYEAALAGADAVLLIVAVLNDRELTHLVKAADD